MSLQNSFLRDHYFKLTPTKRRAFIAQVLLCLPDIKENTILSWMAAGRKVPVYAIEAINQAAGFKMYEV